MNRLLRTALLCSALLLVCLPPAAPAATDPLEGNDVIVALANRSAALKSYTFNIRVAIKMQTFPWMAFHLDGAGEYQRPSHYLVRFKQVPWFGKGFEKLSMAPLDPKNWPNQYIVHESHREGDDTIVVMHDKIKSPLTEMRATVGPKDGVRSLVWTYNYGGKIVLNITPQELSGVTLPSLEDAQITMPNVRATAHAEFKDYHVVVDPPSEDL